MRSLRKLHSCAKLCFHVRDYGDLRSMCPAAFLFPVPISVKLVIRSKDVCEIASSADNSNGKKTDKNRSKIAMFIIF